jgi:tetratricopeptide (TPR) repeat protein
VHWVRVFSEFLIFFLHFFFCNKGHAYASLENYQDALPMYEHALTLSPENNELQTIIGILHFKMGLLYIAV